MHKNFEKLISNLEAVYEVWQKLEDEKKKQKFNLTLPFIQLASFLDGMMVATGEERNRNLQNILDDFALNYQKIFGVDATKNPS